MFWHIFLYELKITIRNKEFLIWLVLFPIILGAFFKVAFSGVYDKDIVFHSIPVAVVQQEEDEMFNSVIDSLANDDEALFTVTYCAEQDALEKLKKEEIAAIIYSDSLSLTVSGSGINQTIVKSFLEQYRVQSEIITDTAINSPEKLEKVISLLSEKIQCNTNIPLTENEMDPYAAYFYNLLAMVALFGSILGLHISEHNQANISAIGARNNCSPVNKLLSITATLCGSFLTHMLSTALCVTYMAFVLNVDFGNRLPFVYMAALLGGCAGVALGFFIGSIGRLGEGAKVTIAMTVSMLSCFTSGLMIGDLKGMFAIKAPWFNKINPAAVISDSLNCLAMYDDYSLYTEKIIYMLLMTVVFTLGGFLLIRRKKYASI